ncbi:zinc dependent phospholipase C family protein [Mucilaginibacter panaciglaebae]|uniref:Phospholipase C/D domain-containing protein n=1 Tax=Mucilaginibacter panaciglaebae TaxID=502331 RepID=A0ABP7W8G2_9SPHI
MKNLSAALALFALFFLTTLPQYAKAYSVFAHEAVIDASWEKAIVPLLKQKYPGASKADLDSARAYAYGGALVADMGYFPFGNPHFTNLLHYVRSGDFVENLIKLSSNLNEYAFSIGALAHYLTDRYGHSLATNVAVPLLYPKDKQKFGNVVTYDDDHTSHKRMEFAFDVLQIARGNYLPQSYHNFIGFNVARPVLERAYLITYGEDINKVFADLSLTIASFRWSVKTLLPALTRTAWIIKKNDILKLNPKATRRSFSFKYNRKDYIKKYGNKREKPKFDEWFFAALIEIAPKIGPLKSLKFKDPGAEGEKLFNKGFDVTTSHYDMLLRELQQKGHVELANIDFDTGKPTARGEYGLADQTFSELVIQLKTDSFAYLTIPLKEKILHFYDSAGKAAKSNHSNKDKIDWPQTYLALGQLRDAHPVPVESLKFPPNSALISKPESK